MDKKITAKVLLVDDEEDFVDNLAQRLELRGLKVQSATRGQDAVSMADSEEFDVIVLDLAMPGMDGLETLRRIRGKHPDAEVIMLTGHGSVKSSVRALKLGAEDYLEKPVDIKELTKKISEARDKRVLILQKQTKKEIEEILRTKAW